MKIRSAHYQPTGRIWTRLKRAIQLARENWQIRKQEDRDESLYVQWERIR